MERLQIGTTVLTYAIACALTGCAFDPATVEDLADAGHDFEGTEGDIGSSEEELIVIPWPGASPPVLTLYSGSGLSGTQLRVTTAPSGRAEQQRLVSTTEIQNAGLLDRINSLRLACGTRDAYVVLFRESNYNAASLWSWSPVADGHVVACDAGQTVDVNLQTVAPAFAGRVSSVYFIAHATGMTEVPLATLVSAQWNGELRVDPPENATPVGYAKLTVRGTHMFDLRQDFELDHWACGARGGHFVLRATLSGSTWTVALVESFVGTSGWDWLYNCHSDMLNELTAEAQGAAAQVRVGLNDVMVQYAGQHPRHYLVPADSLRDFTLASGGDELVVNPN